jgi:hypothetical protein
MQNVASLLHLPDLFENNRHVILHTGKRPCLDLNSTFRHHWEEEEEEGHYEGPTIFDKVFRKSAHKSIETSR